MKNVLYQFLLPLHLTLGALALPLISMGQDDAAALMTQAEQAIEKGDLENAHNLYTEAAGLFEKSSNWASYLESGVGMTNNLYVAGEYEMGVEAAQKFINRAKDVNHKDINLSLLYKNLGKIYYAQDDFKQARPYLEEALAIRESLNPEDPELARDYFNIGIISRFSGRSAKANEHLNKALSLQEDKNVLARIYSEMGVNYRFLGNFRKSYDMQEQAIRLLEELDDPKALAIALAEKGATMTQLKIEGEDITFLKQALKKLQDAGIVDYQNQAAWLKQIGNSYFFFAPVTHRRGFLDSAQVYWEKSLQIANQHLSDNNALQYQLMLDLSSLHALKDDHEAAQTYLGKGENLAEGQFVLKSLEAAEFFSVKGFINRSQGSFQASLEAYQQQLVSLIDDYNEEDIYGLPTEEQCKNSLSMDDISDALALKARCLYQYYKHGGKDKKNLEAALATIRLFDQMINNIRADFANSGSNIAWSDISLDAYENGIEICLALAQETGDANYKNQALYFSEKSKGLTLLEAFQNTKANNVAGLSEEDMIKEREMKLDYC